MDEMNLPRHVSALLSLDTDLECWTKTLPADYDYRALTGPNNNTMGVQVYMGRYDVYSSLWLAHIWNFSAVCE